MCCALLVACRGGSSGIDAPLPPLNRFGPEVTSAVVHVVPFTSTRKIGFSAGQPVYSLFQAKRVVTSAEVPNGVTSSPNVWAFGAPQVAGKAGPLAQIAVQTSSTTGQHLYVDARGRLFEIVDAQSKSVMLISYKPNKNPSVIDTITTVCIRGKEVGTFEEIAKSGTTSTTYRTHHAACPRKVAGAVAFGTKDESAKSPGAAGPSRATVAFYSCMMSATLFPSASDDFAKAAYFSSVFSGLSTTLDELGATFGGLCASSKLIALAKAAPPPTCPSTSCPYSAPPVPITPAPADCATGTFNAPGQTCTAPVSYAVGSGNVKFAAKTSNANVVTVSPGSGTVTGSGTLKVTVTAGSLGGSADVTVTIGSKQTTLTFDNAWTTSATSGIATILFQLPAQILPLSQTMTFGISALTADGRTIVGTYDRPITLTGTNLTISPASVANSTQAAAITATWNAGFAGAANGTIQASADGSNGTVTVTPGSGFVFYDVGTNPTTDVSGFQMALGPDGKIYYGTLGPQTCNPSGLCSSNDGAVGQFDPIAGTADEIELHSEAVGLLFTSDNALWIAGGPSGNLFRLASGSFSAGSLQTIPMPSPTASVSSWQLRTMAADSSRVWVTDLGGHRVLASPIAGPYDGSIVSQYSLPNGPSGTLGRKGNGNGIAYGSGGHFYVTDQNNGVVDELDPESGNAVAQIVPPEQAALGAGDTIAPRFMAIDGSGKILFTFLSAQGFDYYAGPALGGVDSIVPASSSALSFSLPAAPSGRVPDSISANGSLAYYADLSGGLGILNTSSGLSREYPIDAFASTSVLRGPNGVAALPDGTAWFTCFGSALEATFQPLCIGHTVYLSNWSIFPGPAFTVAGLGAAASQPVGIMEAPSANSGPFTATSSNTLVCGVSAVQDHNFVVTGESQGTCSITVTDAAAHSQSVAVTVQPTPAPSPSPLARVRHHRRVF
jgi:hypothetical protein